MELCSVLHSLNKEKHWPWANWLIVRAMNRKQYLNYAIFAAEQVIHIWEKRYPEDSRPRQAINAAKAALENDTEENKKLAYSATLFTLTEAATSATSAAESAASYAARHTAYVAFATSAEAAAESATSAAFAADSASYAAYAAYASSAAAAAARHTVYVASAGDSVVYAAVDASSAAYTNAGKEMQDLLLNYAIELLSAQI